MHEHPDQFPYEQGVAAGRRREATQQVLRKPGSAQHAGGELGGRAGVEAAEVDRLAYPSADGDQVGPDFAKLGPGEGQHKDRYLLHPLHEVLDEVEEQGVGPLDVVDDDDQRPVARQHLDVTGVAPKRSPRPSRELPAVRPLRSRRMRSRSGTPTGTSASRSRARSTSTIGRQGDGPLDVAAGLDHPGLALGPGELRGQPALADAGIADDRDQPGGPRSDRVVECGLEPPDLVGPADEGSGVGGLRLAAEPLVHHHRRGPPLHLHLAQGFVPVSAARRPPRLLSDDDVAARTLGLEPGRDVQGVADEVGVAGADDDLAGVHRDPQGELDTLRFGYPGGEVDEALLQLDGGVDGAPGVVGADLRNTPDGHEPVADVLRDARPVALRG